jgi:anti-sigma factor ChrR (cupin superfamily)
MPTQELSTPKKKHEPTPGGSIYIKPDTLAWRPTRFDKVSIKVLYEDLAAGEMTVLVKLDPGAYIPFHMHPELEQAYMLEGAMHDHDGVAVKGDFIWRKGGSKHDNSSPDGALILAVYRKPNIYYHAAGEATAGF